MKRKLRKDETEPRKIPYLVDLRLAVYADCGPEAKDKVQAWVEAIHALEHTDTTPNPVPFTIDTVILVGEAFPSGNMD